MKTQSSIGRLGVLAVLAGGVFVASTGAILVRYAQGAGVESLAVAAWRLTLASSLLALIAVWRGRVPWQGVSGPDLRLALLAGVMLGLHFGLWISSLAATSVASSVALVSSTPIWVALASVLLQRERLRALTWIGILTSLAGIGLILRADGLSDGLTGLAIAPSSARVMGGNLLALGGALAFGAYLLIGRRLAGRIRLLDYVSIVYGSAAVALLMAAVASGASLAGYSASAWLALIGLALGPQLLAHTVFNWAVGRLTPTFVSLATLGEPLGSALLAALLLGEVPSSAQGTALAVLLAGIGLAALAERGGARQPPEGRPGTDH